MKTGRSKYLTKRVTTDKTRRDRLTSKQTKYVRLLREIFEIIEIDFENVRRYPSATERTAQLERILGDVIRGDVITNFTLIDELLTNGLARKIVGDHITGRRSKRLQIVKTALIESRLSLSRKLAVFRSLVRVPDDVVGAISRLNKLRNHMAHEFHLDVRSKKLTDAGKNILSVEGLRLFESEQMRVFMYLLLR